MNKMTRFGLRLLIVAWYLFFFPFNIISPLCWILTGFGANQYEDALDILFNKLEDYDRTNPNRCSKSCGQSPSIYGVLCGSYVPLPPPPAGMLQNSKPIKPKEKMPTIPKPSRRAYLPPRETQGRRLHANSAFYQSSRWRRLRQVKLNADPLCEECRRRGLVTEATVVDHIVPINEGGAALDLRNLQSLCDACHNRKSGREAHKRTSRR